MEKRECVRCAEFPPLTRLFQGICQTAAPLRTNKKRPSPYGEGRFGAFDYSDT